MNISMKHYFSLLVRYLKPQKLKALLLFFLLLLNITFTLLNPQILRIFIDTGVQNGASLTLLFMGIFYIISIVLLQIISVTESYLGTYVGWTAMNTLRLDVLTHCLTLDLGYYKSHTPGEMIERIDDDVNQLTTFFSDFLNNMVTHTILLAGILILFFTIYWLIGICMLLFVLVALVGLFFLRRRTGSIWIQQRQKSADFFSFLMDCLKGAEDIRASGAIAYIMRFFFILRREWFPINKRAFRVTGQMVSGTGMLLALGTVLALAVSAYLWGIGAISIGTVYLVFTYTTLLMYPLQNIQTQFQGLQQADACIGRIEELLQTSSALPSGNDHFLAEGPLTVDFRQITFGYTVEQPVLHELTLHLPPGKILGILGRTGSGKTTLARLLFRLYDPQNGEILLNNVCIKNMRLRDLRRHIGLVTQDVQLFHASIRDNLTFFDRTIRDEQIIEVLANVGLQPWYYSQRAGLDTMLGSEAIGLSAGEAQLLALARLFLASPNLVILDEASARLDPATENLVEQAIEKLLVGRTAIVIAHRLSTVQRSDEILILEDGYMIEYGNRAQLMRDPASHFAQLLKNNLEEVNS